MKTKILQALKTKYSSKGLSEKALDGVASILEKTVTDESQIEAAISEAPIVNLINVRRRLWQTTRRLTRNRRGRMTARSRMTQTHRRSVSCRRR